MQFDKVANNILALGILIGFFFLLYSQLRKQSIQQTFKQVTGMFGGKKNGK